jgi:hypothetical protein
MPPFDGFLLGLGASSVTSHEHAIMLVKLLQSEAEL